MTAIVINLATGAPTEYDWTFPALSASHAGSDDGLFELGGDTDDGVPIDAGWDTGTTLREGSKKNAVDSAYFTMEGAAGSKGLFRVHTPTATYSYPFDVRQAGVSRAKAGRGIKENMLGFGYENVDGAQFAITMMEVSNTPSEQRRI